MTEIPYQGNLPVDAIDALIVAGSGPEPYYDSVMQSFLRQNHLDLQKRCQEASTLVDVASLGLTQPWLYRLAFRTRGLVRHADSEIATTDRHVVALRFLPDYLRKADRFAMLRLIEPAKAFHPNIAGGAICVEIYAGEPLIEICQALHDLFRWRLRQYDERDALNAAACAWGREHIHRPIDDRPLFGKRLKLQWQAKANA